MAVELSAIVGADHMTADSKDAVIDIIRGLNTLGTVKRYTYARWCRSVGIDARPEDLNRVATVERGA